MAEYNTSGQIYDSLVINTNTPSITKVGAFTSVASIYIPYNSSLLITATSNPPIIKIGEFSYVRDIIPNQADDVVITTGLGQPLNKEQWH